MKKLVGSCQETAHHHSMEALMVGYTPQTWCPLVLVSSCVPDVSESTSGELATVTSEQVSTQGTTYT